MTCRSKGGWVIWNLRDKSCISPFNVNVYETLVPSTAVKSLGGVENTLKAIAIVGGWNIEDLSMRNGNPDIWGDEAEDVYIVSRHARD